MVKISLSNSRREMSMKIILLSGKPHSGKSTALRLFYDKLMAGGKCRVVSKKESDDGRDFECVLKYNDKTVAIKSAGDVYQWCIEAIIKYANRDVLVLAYSDKFARSLEEIVSWYDYHCIVKKKCAIKSDNERVCTEIMEQL
jgi:tRNA uridine 5-carbamoylmethylation protein Kti12